MKLILKAIVLTLTTLAIGAGLIGLFIKIAMKNPNILLYLAFGFVVVLVIYGIFSFIYEELKEKEELEEKEDIDE